MVKEDEVQRLERVYRAYADSSSVRAQWDERNRGNRVIARERLEAVRRLLQRHGLLPLGDRRVLEVGCGRGERLAEMEALGARQGRLAGLDLSADRVAEARRLLPGADVRQANAEDLPFADASFDIVLCATLFSSILDEGMAQNVAREMARVVKPGKAGLILWYDIRYANPRNANVRPFGARQIARLFPGFQTELFSITLLPPLARRLGPMTRFLYPVLAAAPPLRSHYLGALWRE